MSVVREYNPPARGRRLRDSCMISPQKNGWNHFYFSDEIAIKSGFRTGDRFNPRQLGDDLIFEKSQDGKQTVRSYNYGSGIYLAWNDVGLSIPTRYGRSKGIGVQAKSPSRGKIVVPDFF